DHDWLLGLALDDDRAVEAEDRIVLFRLSCRLVKSIDNDRARERDFRTRELEQLLSNDLSRKKPLRLIGEKIDWIESLALRQSIDDGRLEPIDIVASRRRNWDNLRKHPRFAVLVDDWQELGFPDEIDLVENQEHGNACVLHQIQHEPIAFARS